MSREFVMGARMNLIDDFTGPLKSMIKQTQMFKETVETGASGMRTFDTAVDRAESSMSQMARQSSEATREIREQATAASTLGSRLTSLQGIVAAVAGSMVVKGAYDWMIGANANMEQYQNTLSVVLGSQKKAVDTLAWANKFAAQTPFEIPQIVEATTRMSAYGINAKKTMGIVGDMASVMGKDLMQAVEAVADAQTGELERLKEFGITKTMIQDQAKMMGKNPINNKGQITDAKAFNAAMFSLMEKRFKGGMEIQSKSFKGMLSNATDFMGSMGRKLGAPLFDKAKAGLGDFLSFLNRLNDSGAIDGFVSKTQKIGGVIWDAFSFAGSLITGVFNVIKGPASAAIGFLSDNFQTLKPYIIGVGAALLAYSGYLKLVALQTRIVTAATAAWNAVTKLSPIWLVAAAVGLLIGYLIHLAGGWGVVKQKMIEFLPVLQQTWNKIVTAVIPILKQLWTIALAVFNNFKTVLLPVILGVVNNIVTMFGTLVNWIRTHWNTISAIIQIAWAIISSYITSGINTAQIIITGGFQVISSVISGTWKMISGILQVGWSVITGLFKTGLALLQGDWQGAWDSMMNMLTGVWDGITDFFSGLKETFFDSGKAIMETLADGIKSMASAPFNAVKSALKKARDLLPFSDAKTGPFSQLTHNGGKIMTTLAEGVYKRSGMFHKAMHSSLSGASLSTGARANGYRVNPGGASGNSSTTNSRSVKYGDINININGSKIDNIQDMGREIIAVLLDQLKEADAILGSDMRELL